MLDKSTIRSYFLIISFMLAKFLLYVNIHLQIETKILVLLILLSDVNNNNKPQICNNLGIFFFFFVSYILDHFSL